MEVNNGGCEFKCGKECHAIRLQTNRSADVSWDYVGEKPPLCSPETHAQELESIKKSAGDPNCPHVSQFEVFRVMIGGEKEGFPVQKETIVRKIEAVTKTSETEAFGT